MMKWMIVAAACLMIATPALAGHEEWYNGWMTLQWDEFDDAIRACNALGEVSLGSGLYLVQRELPNGQGWESGPLEGGSTVIYHETNGREGLQLNYWGPAAFDRNGNVAYPYLDAGDAGAYYEDRRTPGMYWPCPHGDSVVYASNMPALF